MLNERRVRIATWLGSPFIKLSEYLDELLPAFYCEEPEVTGYRIEDGEFEVAPDLPNLRRIANACQRLRASIFLILLPDDESTFWHRTKAFILLLNPFISLQHKDHNYVTVTSFDRYHVGGKYDCWQWTCVYVGEGVFENWWICIGEDSSS
jgi:hypothetical protein